MANIMWENMKMIKNMDKDNSHGKMEKCIQEDGIKENNMVKGILLRILLKESVYLRMVDQ